MDSAKDVFGCRQLNFHVKHLFLKGMQSFRLNTIKSAIDPALMATTDLPKLFSFAFPIPQKAAIYVQLHRDFLAFENHFVSMGKSPESTV